MSTSKTSKSFDFHPLCRVSKESRSEEIHESKQCYKDPQKNLFSDFSVMRAFTKESFRKLQLKIIKTIPRSPAGSLSQRIRHLPIS